MVEFIAHYFQYRRVGFGRIAALRFAWLVGGGRPADATRRLPAR